MWALNGPGQTAGQGTLYSTQLSVAGLNVTVYAVKTASGGFNLVVVNKDPTQNLMLTAQLPQGVTSATLLQMTQLSTGATAPNLLATMGLTIQGAGVNNDGSFSPLAAYTLSVTGSQFKCYVPALSAVLVQIT